MGRGSAAFTSPGAKGRRRVVERIGRGQNADGAWGLVLEALQAAVADGGSIGILQGRACPPLTDSANGVY